MKLARIISGDIYMKKEIKVIHEQEVTPVKIVEGELSKRLITNEREGSSRFSFAIVSMNAGLEKIEGEDNRDNLAFVMQGAATLSYDSKKIKLNPGSAVYIPAGCKCTMTVHQDIKLAVVVSPPRI